MPFSKSSHLFSYSSATRFTFTFIENAPAAVEPNFPKYLLRPHSALTKMRPLQKACTSLSDDDTSPQALHVLDMSYVTGASEIRLSACGELHDELRALIPQLSSWCRIYLIYGLQACNTFTRHFHDLVGQDFSGFYSSTECSARSALQFGLGTSQVSWTEFDFYTSALDEMVNFSKGLVKYTMKVRYHFYDDDRIICFILCDSDNPVRPKSFCTSSRIVHRDLCTFATHLTSLNSPWKGNLANMTTTAMRHHLLFLRLVHATLFCHADFLTRVERARDLAMADQPDFVANSSSAEPHLWEISATARGWQTIADGMILFACTAADALLEASLLRIEDEELPVPRAFREFLLDIRVLSSRNKSRARAVSRALDSSIAWYRVLLNLRRSSELSRLAIVYLALSLVCSMLSILGWLAGLREEI
ncbi:hypothetical protein BJX64DRAFT_221993 [Aspergillus heterothallicus]